MNRDQFINYLKQPEVLDAESVKELTELVNEYPYFQTARLLLVKGLHNCGDIKYNNQLKVTAAYVTDRKLLFHLIKDDAVSTERELISATEKPQEVKDIDIKESTEESSSATSPVKPEIISESENNIVPDIQDDPKSVIEKSTAKVEEIIAVETPEEELSEKKDSPEDIPEKIEHVKTDSVLPEIEESLKEADASVQDKDSHETEIIPDEATKEFKPASPEFNLETYIEISKTEYDTEKPFTIEKDNDTEFLVDETMDEEIPIEADSTSKGQAKIEHEETSEPVPAESYTEEKRDLPKESDKEKQPIILAEKKEEDSSTDLVSDIKKKPETVADMVLSKVNDINKQMTGRKDEKESIADIVLRKARETKEEQRNAPKKKVREPVIEEKATEDIIIDDLVESKKQPEEPIDFEVMKEEKVAIHDEIEVTTEPEDKLVIDDITDTEVSIELMEEEKATEDNTIGAYTEDKLLPEKQIEIEEPEKEEVVIEAVEEKSITGDVSTPDKDLPSISDVYSRVTDIEKAPEKTSGAIDVEPEVRHSAPVQKDEVIEHEHIPEEIDILPEKLDKVGEKDEKRTADKLFKFDFSIKPDKAVEEFIKDQDSMIGIDPLTESVDELVEKDPEIEKPAFELDSAPAPHSSGESYTFSEWLSKLSTAPKPLEEERKSISQDDFQLIDKFISSQPEFVAVSDGNVNTEDKSAKSITEDDALITETLAKIYISQRNYSKAIRAYEKLSLKYPEKSVYFASQIEKLNNTIK